MLMSPSWPWVMHSTPQNGLKPGHKHPAQDLTSSSVGPPRRWARIQHPNETQRILLPLTNAGMPTSWPRCTLSDFQDLRSSVQPFAQDPGCLWPAGLGFAGRRLGKSLLCWFATQMALCCVCRKPWNSCSSSLSLFWTGAKVVFIPLPPGVCFPNGHSDQNCSLFSTQEVSFLFFATLFSFSAREVIRVKEWPSATAADPFPPSCHPQPPLSLTIPYQTIIFNKVAVNTSVFRSSD